jgi:hypothetical protein
MPKRKGLARRMEGCKARMRMREVELLLLLLLLLRRRRRRAEAACRLSSLLPPPPLLLPQSQLQWGRGSVP